MPAIDFTLAKSKRRRDWIDTDINFRFDEKIHVYLSNREKNNTNMRLLIYLDQYSDKLFTENEIKELINISEYLLSKYQAEYDRMEKEIRKFAMGMKALCLEAIERNLLIVSLGD